MGTFGHEDKERAAEYRKSGRFVDRRSKVFIRKDGTERIVLQGTDKIRLREKCLARDGWKCVDAGKDGVMCHWKLDMSHDPAMSKSEGSDVLEQVRTRCRWHHNIFDRHDVRLRSVTK